jgi:hypothetical protein
MKSPVYADIISKGLFRDGQTQRGKRMTAMFAVALYSKSKVTGYELNYQVSILRIGKDSCHVQTGSGAHPATDCIDIRNSFSEGGGEGLEHEGDHSFPSSAENMNAWGFTSTSPTRPRA